MSPDEWIAKLEADKKFKEEEDEGEAHNGGLNGDEQRKWKRSHGK